MDYNPKGWGTSGLDTDKKECRAIVGENLKALMKINELTQNQVAERGGLSQKMVHSVRNGLHAPTVENLNRLAKGCGVDMRVLLTRWESLADLERANKFYQTLDKMIALNSTQRESVLEIVNGMTPAEKL